MGSDVMLAELARRELSLIESVTHLQDFESLNYSLEEKKNI